MVSDRQTVYVPSEPKVLSRLIEILGHAKRRACHMSVDRMSVSRTNRNIGSHRGSGPAGADLLIVGAGSMAQAHALAARELGCAPLAVTRRQDSAEQFSTVTGFPATGGGLAAWLENNNPPAAAVVAISVDHLASSTELLLASGVKRILVEKPGGVNAEELSGLAAAAQLAHAQVFVGYNRRFYGSTALARELLDEDGGPTSCRFDFTEVAEAAQSSHHSDSVKQAWLLANSSHVIDLAFFLAGPPTLLQAFADGSLPWHPLAARFSGCGMTKLGVNFSYHADWTAPGRWSVDIRSRRRRFLFEPLEQLRVQSPGSFEVVPVEFDDACDRRHKPGILKQLEMFLSGRSSDLLVDISTQANWAREVYEPILRGTKTPYHPAL